MIEIWMWKLLMHTKNQLALSFQATAWPPDLVWQQGAVPDEVDRDDGGGHDEAAGRELTLAHEQILEVILNGYINLFWKSN